MPIIALEVPETYDSITRPITIGLVRDLLGRFGLPNDTRVMYVGTAGSMAEAAAALTTKTSDAVFPFKSKVKIDLEETYLEDNVLTTAIKRKDNNDVFYDPSLGVHMYPVYTRVENTLSFTYTSNSKNDVERWRDRLRRKSSEGMRELLHELIYHYSPPLVFHQILKDIYAKRESVAGYNQSFLEWIDQCYDDRLTVLTNMAGGGGLPAIAEKQIHVQGWFSFPDQPEKPEKGVDGDTWELNFEYTIRYDKITAMVMDYPIVVHNQLLDMKYIPTEKPYDPYDQPRKPSFTGSLNDTFSVINYDKEPPYQGVVIPDFDDWIPNMATTKTIPILTALVAVEPNDPYTLLNLNELGDVAIPDTILTYLRNERTRVTDYLSNVFFISFFRGKNIQDFTTVYLDENLTIKSTIPLNLRDVHHIQFSIVSDLRMLRPVARDSLLNNPDVAFKVVTLLEELLGANLNFTSRAASNRVSTTYDQRSRSRYTPGRPGVRPAPGVLPPTAPKEQLVDYLKVIGERLVTKTSFEEVVSRLKTTVDLAEVGQGRGMNSIANVGIISHKR